MARRDFFVQLDPQPGAGRRDDVAILPLDRLAQELGVEPGEGKVS